MPRLLKNNVLERLPRSGGRRDSVVPVEFQRKSLVTASTDSEQDSVSSPISTKSRHSENFQDRIGQTQLQYSDSRDRSPTSYTSSSKQCSSSSTHLSSADDALSQQKKSSTGIIHRNQKEVEAFRHDPEKHAISSIEEHEPSNKTLSAKLSDYARIATRYFSGYHPPQSTTGDKTSTEVISSRQTSNQAAVQSQQRHSRTIPSSIINPIRKIAAKPKDLFSTAQHLREPTPVFFRITDTNHLQDNTFGFTAGQANGSMGPAVPLPPRRSSLRTAHLSHPALNFSDMDLSPNLSDSTSKMVSGVGRRSPLSAPPTSRN